MDLARHRSDRWLVRRPGRQLLRLALRDRRLHLPGRWLREGSRGRPTLEWWQLAVPAPAFVLLLLGLVPFSALQPIVDPAPGGGLWLFALALAGFVGLAAYGIWDPGRGTGDGEGAAMIDLHAAFGTRLAIHLVFLGALLWLGLATSEPVLLVTSLLMLGLEWPLARLARARSVPGRRTVGVGGGVQHDPTAG